jgi:hypothetical protein
MAGGQQLSRGGALVVGLAFIAAGVMPILIGLGVLHADNVHAPLWVVSAAGLAFVVAGMAVVLDYGIAGGIGPDGDLPPGTPLGIRAANLVLGLTILALLTAVSGWIAFGAGPRAFTTTISLPFWYSHDQSSELPGRIVFGMGTLLLVAMFVACAVVGTRRLQRAEK